MLVRLAHLSKSSRQRALYIVCVCFVMSYIAFDVLDLDGSNLSSIARNLKRSSVLAVLPSGAEISYSSDDAEPIRAIVALPPDNFTNYARFQMTIVPKTSVLGSARAHGYRIGLARDSLPD